MLTARQQLILKHIVTDYVRNATPIASESLTRNHNLGVSSATVRNEVAALEERGYISRPYASAGSVPQDKAYRFYVESLLANFDPRISPQAGATIQDRFDRVLHDVDKWGNVAATLIAQLMDNLGVATFPKTSVSRVRHLELVPVQDVLALLIIVLEQAKLRKQLIRFDEPIERIELESMAVRLRRNMMGLTYQEMAHSPIEANPHERRAIDAAIEMLEEEDRADNDEFYVDGLRNLIDQPEFDDYGKVRPIIRGVEDGSLIHAALSEAPVDQVVRVVIGGEHSGEALRPLSVVICRYGIPGHALGAIGVVGPTRMEYYRAISGVRFISSIMKGMVENVYGEVRLDSLDSTSGVD